MTAHMRSTRVNVSLSAISENIAAVRRMVGYERNVCVPVKADAYGHGAIEVSKAALESGASHLAVATVDEGAELRSAGIDARILLFSAPSPEEVDAAAALALEAFVSDYETAEALSLAASRSGQRLGIHLKIDTGMGRIGCQSEDASTLARKMVGLKGLCIAGTATHLAVSDSLSPEGKSYPELQLERFAAAVGSIRAAGIDPGLVHAANSGAILQYPSAYLDMVRPGILTYGYLPDDGLSGTITLIPAMEFRTQLSFIKRVSKGDSVSYGRIWTAREDTWIGTVPAGYADGLPRRLSGQVLAVGADVVCPQIGRICMDQCMIDLGPEPALSRWDTVSLFGPDPRGHSAADLARLAGTIPYEITCGIGKRVPRIHVR